MRVVPWDGPGDEAGGEPEIDSGRLNAMRSWLVSGVHLFVVDPRRRFGSHGRARELLVVERPTRQEASERWQTLAAALERHTVRDGLAQLSPNERRVITLAYLEGHTNREIAALLGVSVSTVRRRLLTALEHLDTYLRRSGAWLAALILAALAFANGRLARSGRWFANPAATDKVHVLAATLAVGVLGAAAVGYVALSVPAAPGAPPRTAIKAPMAGIAAPAPSLPSGPLSSAGSLLPSGHASIVAEVQSSASANGCHGNPTSGPPAQPVASPTHHPTGPPITHPSAGGC
jgi:sigma-70-like protein